MRITASDLKKLAIIDDIVPEPAGGAHADPEAAAQMVDDALARTLADVSGMSSEMRLAARYDKFRSMGRYGADFIEAGS